MYLFKKCKLDYTDYCGAENLVLALGTSITNFNFIFKGDFYYEKI